MATETSRERIGSQSGVYREYSSLLLPPLSLTMPRLGRPICWVTRVTRSLGLWLDVCLHYTARLMAHTDEWLEVVFGARR